MTVGRATRCRCIRATVGMDGTSGRRTGLLGGFSRQDFPSSLAIQSVPELRFKPATRYENACASGSAAIHGARDFLAAGRGRFALVLGAEKMTLRV